MCVCVYILIYFRRLCLVWELFKVKMLVRHRLQMQEIIRQCTHIVRLRFYRQHSRDMDKLNEFFLLQSKLSELQQQQMKKNAKIIINALNLPEKRFCHVQVHHSPWTHEYNTLVTMSIIEKVFNSFPFPECVCLWRKYIHIFSDCCCYSTNRISFVRDKVAQ